jgi:L-malate glycosyltransferase
MRRTLIPEIEKGHGRPIKTAFVLHIMQVAGAEMLVAATIRQLRPLIDPVVLCLDGLGALAEALKAEDVPVVHLERRPGLDLKVSRRLAHEITERGCEVVHAHQYTPFFYAALAKPLARHGFHLMFTEHGRHYPDIVSSKRHWLNRIIFSRLADEVNAVCEFSAASLGKIEGFRRRPIEIIPNGIEPARYHQPGSRADRKSALGLNPALKHIACIARFHPVKDHATLLRAFSETLLLREDIELLLVGGGPLRDSLEQQAISLGIAQRVRFLGIRNDVPAILSAADIFVLSSVSEAASLTLLEAMASAVPVVVTDVGGNGEIVRQGVEGLLTPRGDSSAMARAFLELLSDSDRASAMGLNGRARVEQSFRLENTINSYYRRYAIAAQKIRQSTKRN